MLTLDVVVATFNRPAPLKRCLEALAAQSVLPRRVIVIDDCSDPPVPGDLRAGASGLTIEVLRTERNGGPARARNLGVSRSNADVVLFIDDDVVAGPTLVARHLAAHEARPHCAVIGPLRAPADWRPTPWNRWEAATLADQYDSIARGAWPVSWRQFFTGNASVRRVEFVEAGGFDERFTRAEDIELALRLSLRGVEFQLEPEAVGWHYAERSRQSWQRMAGEYARFDLLMDRIYPDLAWKEHVRREQRQRHWLVRGVCSLSAALCAERLVARSGVTAATGAARLGATPASVAMLTVAFTVEYRRALREGLPPAAFSPWPAGPVASG